MNDDSTISTKVEPYGRMKKDMLDSSPMSENLSEALVKADPEAAIHTAIGFWAEGSTRAETRVFVDLLTYNKQIIDPSNEEVTVASSQLPPELVSRTASDLHQQVGGVQHLPALCAVSARSTLRLVPSGCSLIFSIGFPSGKGRSL